MAYVALISKSDFSDIGVVPDGLKDNRIDPMIRKAQELDLLPFLGAALYTDIQADPTDADYVKLINGDTYQDGDGNDIYFPGLKMAIMYWTWARLLPGNQNTLTSHSFVQKTNPYSTPVEGENMSIEVNSAKSAAVQYWKQVEDYLNAKESVFTLWKCTVQRKTGAVRINSISKND